MVDKTFDGVMAGARRATDFCRPDRIGAAEKPSTPDAADKKRVDFCDCLSNFGWVE